jgi:hypothetical protein
MEEVREMVSDVYALQVLFVFDSCFSGSVFSSRSPSPRIEHLSQEEVTRLLSMPVREFITAGDANERIPATSPLPELFLNAIHGDADAFHIGVVTGEKIANYLWVKTRDAGYQITPREGKIPGVFERGKFLFRTGRYYRPIGCYTDKGDIVGTEVEISMRPTWRRAI